MMDTQLRYTERLLENCAFIAIFLIVTFFLIPAYVYLALRKITVFCKKLIEYINATV
jgi:hypothetical protein